VALAAKSKPPHFPQGSPWPRCRTAFEDSPRRSLLLRTSSPRQRVAPALRTPRLVSPIGKQLLHPSLPLSSSRSPCAFCRAALVDAPCSVDRASPLADRLRSWPVGFRRSQCRSARSRRQDERVGPGAWVTDAGQRQLTCLRTTLASSKSSSPASRRPRTSSKSSSPAHFRSSASESGRSPASDRSRRSV